MNQATNPLEEFAAAWRRRWPSYCTSCNGWGGQVGRGGAGRLFEPCQALPDGQCHRCATPNSLEADNQPPCKACGWDNSGMPGG